MTNDDGSHTVKSYSSRCRPMRIPAEGRLTRPAFIEDITPISSDTPLEDTLGICLNNMGFHGMPSVSPGDCFLLKQHLETCPTCRGASHATASPYFIEALIDDCFTVRNIEQHCTSRIVDVQTMVTQHPNLKRIIAYPSTDLPLAKLFISECGKDMTSVDDTVFSFEAGRWRKLDTKELENRVQEFLDHVLNKLMDLLTWEARQVQRTGTNAEVKSLRSLNDRFNEAVKYVQKNRGRHDILSAISTKLHDSSLKGKWNRTPDTLGLNNGIVDLQMCTFRPAVKEDYVTLSCDYDWPKAWDPNIQDTVEDFMQQVYPLEDERRLFQKWAGYCLLGSHEAKHFLCLTDARGGYNGKSTVLALLMATMGQYAIKADPCVLYKSDKIRHASDHNAGLLAFEFVRLMVAEELDSSKVLDQEALKDLHGGGARVTGRQMWTTTSTGFPWITKLIMAMNEGNMPSMNCSDEAFVERMLTICHRARFQNNVTTSDPPYTFAADPLIKQAFPAWRPYFLKYCLEGLSRYHAEGFKRLPESCQAFKQQLVASKDVVAEFVGDAVEEGVAGDFVTVKDLFNDFNVAYRLVQADKKTRKDQNAFRLALKKILNPNKFKNVHHYKIGGKPTTTSSAYMEYRRKTSHA